MSTPRPFLHVSVLHNVCRQCSRRIVGRSAQPFSQAELRRTIASASSSPRLQAGYFLSNPLLNRIKHPQKQRSSHKSVASHVSTATKPSDLSGASASSSADLSANVDLPHRRRQAQRRKNNATQATAVDALVDPKPLPPDASSVLATVAARHPAHSIRRQLSALLSLSKPRLTVLVVLSAMAPYALYPVPAFLSSTALAEAPSLSPLTLLFLTTGTTLCSASANALNMLYEPSTDAVMSRTRNRPLVRRLVSTRAAVLFAILCGAAGTAGLYFGVNPTVSVLGAANIALYAGVYTPMKRFHWLNTWVGALVGAIPPLMGWAAAAGEAATGDGSFRELLLASDGSSIGGWLLAGLLFAWQFPHFMALSWPVREEYKAAGLRMLAWVDPARNARVALRYSLVFVPLCVALCAAGITEWSFAVTSLPVNAWLVREAVRFWRLQGHGGSARGLFWASVWHLPVVMVLALVQKKGMWGRVWRSVVGDPDGEWEEEDDENEGGEDDGDIGDTDILGVGAGASGAVDGK